MLENIKDFIFVTNAIPSDVCDKMVADVTKLNTWERHQWQNYGVTVERPSFPPTELFVAESLPEQNALLYPLMGEALKEYEETISKQHSFGEFKVNCGLHMACPVRFNRYDTHTLMKTHHDHIHSLFDGERKGIPTLSIVGLINDDYEGGNFFFFDDYEIKLKKGDILIFPSLFMFPHRVEKVTKGVRHSFVSWAW
jgi:hypothetical protein